MVILLPYAVAGLMEMCSAAAKGLGKVISTTVITLIGTCLLRVVWIYTVFDANPTLLTLYICFPITWALTGGIICVMVLQTIRGRVRKEAAEEILEEAYK
jgi:Na+-driven multidrug efflux pump